MPARTMEGSKVTYSWTVVGDDTSPPAAINLTGGSASMSYKYGSDGTPVTAAVDNTLDTTGLVEKAITHASIGIFYYQFFGVDSAGAPWRSEWFSDEVDAKLDPAS